MSEAIRSSAAAVSGGIQDRGLRDAEQDAIESRQESSMYLRRGTKRAKKQLTKGYKATGALYKPYREAGMESFEAAQDMAGNFQFDPSQITSNPAYQFRLDQGLEAQDRRFAARGGLGSGSRLIGIQDYAQGLASTEYDNEYNRQYELYQGNFNRHMGIAGMGYDATNAQAQNINNYRGGIANLIMGRANAMAGTANEMGDIRAATEMGRAGNWASTNMYMGDQAAQGWDNYMGMVFGGAGGGAGGSKKSGGGAAA